MSGTRPIAVVAGLLLFGVAIRNAAPQSLVPAGSINDAVGRPGAVIVTQADPAIEKFVETIQKRFFPKSRVRQDSDTPEADLAGVDLIVYGTPKHAWLARHAAKLPFRFGEGTLEIDGRRFAGEHLRVICAMKSPSDPSRRALVYAAAKADDVVGINGVFHGPTEWVVADGTKSLGAGSFTSAAISVDDLRSDLDTLVAALRDVHPATVEGLPPDVQRAVDATREALREPMTRTAAWRALSRVLVEMHDAHSVLWPPASGDRLALSFVWLEGGLVVSTDEGDLKRGDRILAINGNDEARLTAALRSIVSTENANWLHARGEDVLCDLGTLRVLGLATEFPVPLRIERGGATIDVKVGRSIAGARPHPSEPWVRFAIDKEHGLGVFTLDRCVVDAQYQETLARFFRVVEEQGIGRIAVDVRANGGGDSSVVDEFLRYVDVDGYVNFGGDVRFSSAVALKHWGR
ncbi:MAG: hypothetical protein HYR85_26805 [Planctomycetes bacterium]|nr:hypothetical protein [Planctomycetota bacterium]